MPLDGTTNPVNEILFGAIEYLEKYSLCQNTTVDGARSCLWSAVRGAAPDGYSGGPLFKAALRRIVDANPEITALGIPGWNDVPGRTKEEAIDALARSIQP